MVNCQIGLSGYGPTAQGWEMFGRPLGKPWLGSNPWFSFYIFFSDYYNYNSSMNSSSVFAFVFFCVQNNVIVLSVNRISSKPSWT